jgi:hypothetical protein
MIAGRKMRMMQRGVIRDHEIRYFSKPCPTRSNDREAEAKTVSDVSDECCTD